MRLRGDASGPSPAALRELSSGIDALYMSGRCELSAPFVSELSRLRDQAAEAGAPVEVELDGEVFQLHPNPLGRYRYRLGHEFGQLGVSDGGNLPPLRFQPRSEFLHAQGATAAAEWFHDLASSLGSGVALSASRLDLYSDWQGWVMTGESRHEFVGRAKRRDTHEESAHLTGFEFGRRKTNTVMARVYDKVRDIRTKGTDWWFAVWGDSYDPAAVVYRVEFEFGRKGLAEYGVNSVESAIAAAPGLWREAITSWLSHRTPTADSTHARWPVSPEWHAVQHPSFAEHAIGLERARAGRQAGSLRKLLPGLNGYMVSLAAHLGANSIEETTTLLPKVLREYEAASGRSFIGRVVEKRRAFASAQ